MTTSIIYKCSGDPISDFIINKHFCTFNFCIVNLNKLKINNRCDSKLDDFKQKGKPVWFCSYVCQPPGDSPWSFWDMLPSWINAIIRNQIQHSTGCLNYNKSNSKILQFTGNTNKLKQRKELTFWFNRMVKLKYIEQFRNPAIYRQYKWI